MSKRIITIGRQFGSNGHRLGVALSKRLGINCYDRELIELAAQKLDIPFDQLSLVDEMREKPWAYQSDVNSALDRRYRYEHIDEQLFHAQSEVIRQLAQQESCIIVGRCADYVLRDLDSLLSIYFYAPYELRIKTVMERYDLDEKKAEKLMNKVDKDRSYYYNYYTDQYWEDMESYHLCLDTGAFSEEDLLDLLEHAYRQLEI